MPKELNRPHLRTCSRCLPIGEKKHNSNDKYYRRTWAPDAPPSCTKCIGQPGCRAQGREPARNPCTLVRFILEWRLKMAVVQPFDAVCDTCLIGPIVTSMAKILMLRERPSGVHTCSSTLHTSQDISSAMQLVSTQ